MRAPLHGRSFWCSLSETPSAISAAVGSSTRYRRRRLIQFSTDSPGGFATALASGPDSASHFISVRLLRAAVGTRCSKLHDALLVRALCVNVRRRLSYACDDLPEIGRAHV